VIDREIKLSIKTKLSGKFIVFDGPDGSGKSTQISLVAEKLTADGLHVVRGIDPGGTVIGDRIRSILLDYDLSQMDVRCETFLFMASRAQLIGEIVAPALKAGSAVLCDRFISATCAYQGAAGYDIKKIIQLGHFAIGNTWPDLTLIIDVPPETGFQRNTKNPKNAGPDAMESRPLDFHRKVRENFLNLPAEYPGKVEIINGTGSPQEVHQRIMEVIERVDF